MTPAHNGPMDVERIMQTYADLAVRVGVNLQPGQYVIIQAKLEHVPLVRAVTESAYKAGARYVSVIYYDDHVRRSMIEHASEEDLSWTPPHLLEAVKNLEEMGGAKIAIVGDAEPKLMADLDPKRVGKAKMVELANASMGSINRKTVNWTIVACPNVGWAQELFGEPDVERLWDSVAKATRLYDEDPVESWWAQVERLSERATAVNKYSFDALHYEGPGTDLTVGLHEDGNWVSGNFKTASGIRHVPNLPTEEVFTTPDYRRVDGVISATMPLQLSAEGVTVNDLKITFEGGRAVKVEASSGGEVVEAQMSVDEGGGRLGEVALVDQDSAVGRTEMIFNNTLFDENATSHIAYGAAYSFCVDGAAGLSKEELLARGVNDSAVHTDFMIGGPGVNITGVTKSGDRVPIIIDNVWQL